MTEKTLTEKWKEKKLPRDYYYVKYQKGYIEMADNLMGGFLMSVDNPIVEILAPVPTYEEYLESEAHCAAYSEANKNLKEKLDKAIERLKITIDLLTDPDCVSSFEDSLFIARRISQTLEEIREIK